MSATRLTNADLKREEAALADLAYTVAYGSKTRAWMNAAPQGALPTQAFVEVTVGRRWGMLYFAGGVERPVLAKHHNRPLLRLEPTDALAVKIIEHVGKRRHTPRTAEAAA